MNRHRRRTMPKLQADINVVPYIDVMLVLLVIFMITAPLLTQGIRVALPQASGKTLPPKQLPIIVSVDQQGQFFLNRSKTPGRRLTAPALKSAVNSLLTTHSANPPAVYIKGDRQVRYDAVMQAMVICQQAGADHVGLITQPADSSS